MNRKLAVYSATAGAALAAPHASAALTLITNANFTFGTAISPTQQHFVSWPTGQASLNAPLTAGAFVIDLGGFRNGTSFGLNAFIGGASTLGLGERKGSGVVPRAGGTVINNNFYFSHHEPLAQLNTGAPNTRLFNTNLKTGYVAFKFNHSAKDYYGWLKAKLTFDPGTSDYVTSIEFIKNINGVYGAYAPSTDTITVGQGSVPEPSITALSGLGLLALGTVGVREMRRRRQTAVSLTK